MAHLLLTIAGNWPFLQPDAFISHWLHSKLSKIRGWYLHWYAENGVNYGETENLTPWGLVLLNFYCKFAVGRQQTTSLVPPITGSPLMFPVGTTSAYWCYEKSAGRPFLARPLTLHFLSSFTPHLTPLLTWTLSLPVVWLLPLVLYFDPLLPSPCVWLILRFSFYEMKVLRKKKKDFKMHITNNFFDSCLWQCFVQWFVE